MKKIRANVASVDITDLGTRPYRFQTHAAIPRHVRVVAGADGDDEIGVDRRLKILQMRALVHYAAHKLQRLVLAPLVV